MNSMSLKVVRPCLKGLCLILLTISSVHVSAAEDIADLRARADTGEAEAQLLLGQCYEKGEGVPKNMVEAAKCFLKAAEKGHVLAQLKFSDCCFSGGGVPEDRVESLAWMYLAASALTGPHLEQVTGLCSRLEQVIGRESASRAFQRSKELLAMIEGQKNHASASLGKSGGVPLRDWLDGASNQEREVSKQVQQEPKNQVEPVQSKVQTDPRIEDLDRIKSELASPVTLQRMQELMNRASSYYHYNDYKNLLLYTLGKVTFSKTEKMGVVLIKLAEILDPKRAVDKATAAARIIVTPDDFYYWKWDGRVINNITGRLDSVNFTEGTFYFFDLENYKLKLTTENGDCVIQLYRQPGR